MNIGKHYRIGRRGAFLSVFGLAYIIIGYSIISTKRGAEIHHIFRFARGLMPLSGYATIWIICGIVALIEGVLPVGRDALGFTVAVIAPVIWSGIYFSAWISNTDGHTIGNSLLESTLLYGLIAIAMTIVAGMPETDSSDFGGGKENES